MNTTTVYFVAPRRVELRTEILSAPQPNQALIQTEISAISAGTELLIFRGEFSAAAPAQGDHISTGLEYPTPYGYCAVGKVIDLGSALDRSWLGQRVFAFKQHTAAFLARLDDLIPVPPELSPEDAVFLANAETAVNLVQDAAPVLGERALILGQGVVGLLTTALLRDFPLDRIVAVDAFPNRRGAAEGLGVSLTLDPSAPDFRSAAAAVCPERPGGFDFTIELSGNPMALDDAIALTGFGGRVILGSWYGSKPAALHLGESFHRSRIRLVASQVSTIAPTLSGRWDKARRLAVAWRALARIRPGRWISHRIRIERAADAYELLDQRPSEALQVVLTYD